jgi:hypothetical protein
MSAAVTAMMFLSQQAHAGEGEPALGVVYVDMEDWQTPDARLYAEEYPELAEAIEASVADLEESLGRLESVTMFAGFSQVDVYIQGSEQALYVQIAADGVGWAEPWDGESMGDRLALSDTGGLAFPPLSIDLDGLPVFYADSGLDSYAVWILFTSGVGGALGSGGGPIGAGVGAAAGGIIGDAIWSLGGMIADSISSAQASGGKPRDQIGGMRPLRRCLL